MSESVRSPDINERIADTVGEFEQLMRDLRSIHWDVFAAYEKLFAQLHEQSYQIMEQRRDERNRGEGTKVYAVIEWMVGDGCHLVGVFSTQEKALALIHEPSDNPRTMFVRNLDEVVEYA